jgi:hypothetical protein
VQAPVVAPRYVDRKEDSFPSEYQAPAEFVGNASNIHAEAYWAPLLGHSADEPTDHNFFTRDYHDFEMAPASRTATNETRCLEGDFMHRHSEHLHHSEINSFQEDVYPYNSEIIPEAYEWNNSPSELETYEDQPLNDMDATQLDLAGASRIAGVHEGDYTNGNLEHPDLLIAEDSVDLRLKNFWRPQRWT